MYTLSYKSCLISIARIFQSFSENKFGFLMFTEGVLLHKTKHSVIKFFSHDLKGPFINKDTRYTKAIWCDCVSLPRTKSKHCCHNQEKSNATISGFGYYSPPQFFISRPVMGISVTLHTSLVPMWEKIATTIKLFERSLFTPQKLRRVFWDVNKVT